jgi:uncharacterized Zn finger protein (UPF0148 family)
MWEMAVIVAAGVLALVYIAGGKGIVRYSCPACRTRLNFNDREGEHYCTNCGWTESDDEHA